MHFFLLSIYKSITFASSPSEVEGYTLFDALDLGSIRSIPFLLQNIKQQLLTHMTELDAS